MSCRGAPAWRSLGGGGGGGSTSILERPARGAQRFLPGSWVRHESARRSELEADRNKNNNNNHLTFGPKFSQCEQSIAGATNDNPLKALTIGPNGGLVGLRNWAGRFGTTLVSIGARRRLLATLLGTIFYVGRARGVLQR